MKKRILSALLSLLLVCTFCPAAAAQGRYTDLGSLRVTFNGDVYTASCWQDERGHIYLPGNAAEKLLCRELGGVSIDGMKYVDMTAAADSCVYDQALDALYIWDGLPGEPTLSGASYPELGAPSDQPITYQDFFELLDRAVMLADPEKLPEWQSKLPEARSAQQTMTRIEGMCALLYAAVTLGKAYSEFNTEWSALNEKIGEGCWDEIASIYDRHDPFALIPNTYPYDLGGFEEASYVYDGWDVASVAYRYSFGRSSAVTGETLFEYDRERNSMRLADDLTVAEAVAALSRFLDSPAERVEDYCVPWNDPEVISADPSCLTQEILDAAAGMPDLTTEEQLIWNGAVLGGDYEQAKIDVEQFALDARKLSEYGFNCARYMISYQLLFDSEVENANLANLRKLDALVAYAVRYRIHLNLVTITVPGRWTETDHDTYTSRGEFDLFVNETHQAQAQRMWALLAARYADVPSSVLSFQPLWECSNGNLSTGLPFTPYTFEQVAAVYADLAEAIRACDPDRFLLYEPTASNEWACTIREAEPVREVMEQFSDVQMLTNFCEMPYVYAEMTAVEGENIDDNNHAMFKPSYPVTYYGVQNYAAPEEPLVLQGGFPAGTQIDLYLSEVRGSGVLRLSLDDGTILYSEALEETVYETGNPLSRYYLYAKSDKKITVALLEEAESVRVDFSGEQLRWSGMDVLLPEAYAVERWWYPSAYDQYLEGDEGPLVIEKRMTSNIQISPNSDQPGEVTIHPDAVCYTTERILAQSNRETIDTWGREISRFAPASAVRIERAAFQLGTEYTSALAYYKDCLDMCGACGLGWFTNDFCFYEMFSPYYKEGSSAYAYAGAVYTGCADGVVLKEMLQLYQEHMVPPTALPQGEAYAALAWESPWEAGEENITVSCRVSYYRNGGAQVLCAFYDGGGRLLEVRTECAAQGEGTVVFQGPPESRAAKCFLLGEGWIPLCPAIAAYG